MSEETTGLPPGGILAVFAYLAATIVALAIAVMNRSALRNIIQEKADTASVTGAQDGSPPASFSRLVGLVGAAYITAFYWGLGLYVLTNIWVSPEKIAGAVDGSSKFVLAGVAMFMPYAFNQVSQVLKPAGKVADLIAAPNESPQLPKPLDGPTGVKVS